MEILRMLLQTLRENLLELFYHMLGLLVLELFCLVTILGMNILFLSTMRWI